MQISLCLRPQLHDLLFAVLCRHVLPIELRKPLFGHAALIGRAACIPLILQARQLGLIAVDQRLRVFLLGLGRLRFLMGAPVCRIRLLFCLLCRSKRGVRLRFGIKFLLRLQAVQRGLRCGQRGLLFRVGAL